LVAYDLSTRQCDVLASSRRREKRSPLDDLTPALSVTGMLPDAPRHRVLFLASFERHMPCYPMYGLWQVNAATGTISQLVELFRSPGGLGYDHRGWALFHFSGYTALSDCDAPWTGVVAFDPATDSPRLVAAWRVEARHRAPKAGPKLLDSGDVAYLPAHAERPYFLANGWTWCGQHRVAVDGSADEPLPALNWEGRTYNPKWASFDAIGDGSQVVATDLHTVWLLTLPAKEKP
jgi:hypothetical protein